MLAKLMAYRKIKPDAFDKHETLYLVFTRIQKEFEDL